ncbi:MAG: TPM domain-containing protein [Lachnospiraceae bacterium]|nr:TPM domain-containing protein [Lachnospiraceae bacterium]
MGRGGGSSGGFGGSGRSSGGFGGSGRSSGGFGGSRPTGGSRPGSGRTPGGFGTGGSRPGRTPGGFGTGGPRPGGYRPSGGYRPTGGYRPAGGPVPTGGPRTGGGCCSSFLVMPIIIILAIMLLLFSFNSVGSTGSSYSNGITESTVTRTALDASECTEYPSYYTDELGWFGNGSEITSGMKQFYQETGVQPYLYLTDTVDGTTSPTEQQMEDYAEEIYDRLFSDNGHLVLLFRQEDNNYGSYDMWITTGSSARHVIDTEACSILFDYVEHYYYDDSYSEEGVFGEAFASAADRIMNNGSASGSGSSSSGRSIFGIVLLAALIIAAVWVFVSRRLKKNKENAKKRQAERDEILNTPLKKFSSDTIDDLKEKYQ